MPDAAPDDPELERLLDAYGQAAVACGETLADAWRRGPEWDARIVARRALLAYVERAYVRRDRLYPDPLDDPAYQAALETEGTADAR